MTSSNHDMSEDRRMIFDALITEYEQLYEHARHDNNAGNAIQALLVTVSFGILAYALDINDYIGIIFAAFASIFLYIYYLFYFEQLHTVIELRFERIIEIEETLSDMLNSQKIGFLSRFHDKWIDKRQKSVLEKKSDYINPSKIAAHLSNKTTSRLFRSWLLIVLVALWAARIFYATPGSACIDAAA